MNRALAKTDFESYSIPEPRQQRRNQVQSFAKNEEVRLPLRDLGDAPIEPNMFCFVLTLVYCLMNPKIYKIYRHY
jgi:hypothetical protein